MDQSNTPAANQAPHLPHLEPVESSQIARVGYDAAAQAIDVEFIRGGIYRYANANAQHYANFRAAESLGSHLQASIKPFHPVTKYNPQTRIFEAIPERPASAKQVEMLRGLTKKAGWWSGGSAERVGIMFRPLVRHLLLPDTITDGEVTVETWIAGLSSAKASEAIEFMKNWR